MYGFKRNLKCSICGRNYNESASNSDHLCSECFEICSYDNQCNDSGEPLSESEAAFIGKLLMGIAKKGGNVEKVKAQNDYIDWDAVTQPVARKGKTHSDKRPRIGVQIGKESFASTQAAFRHLRVNMKHLQKVRAELKANGKATVGKYNFKAL